MSFSCWLAIISLWKSITCISQSSPVEDKNKIKETIVSLSCYRPHLLCGDARPLRFLRSVQGVLSGWTARVAHPALGHHLPSAPALSPPACCNEACCSEGTAHTAACDPGLCVCQLMSSWRGFSLCVHPESRMPDREGLPLPAFPAAF